MASLDRALALAEVDDVPVRIREHLDLDVSRILEVPLDVHRWIGEVRLPLAPCGLEGCGRLLGAGHELQTLAAAAGCRLQGDRPPDVVTDANRVGSALDRLDRPRDDGDARRLHGGPRRGLRPHQLDRLRRRPYPDEARVVDRPCERRVLCEEPVARVNRLGAGTPCRLEQPLDDEIALGGWRRADEERLVGEAGVECAPVRFGVDGHRLDAELTERAEDAHGNLAPICDEHAREGGHALILSERCRLRTS